MSDASSLTLSWRIGVPHYDSDEAFAALMEQVRANADWLDEVAFFETVTHHLYLPLELFAERAAILKRRIEAMRQAGIRSVGINVLATLGHLDEAIDTMPPLPFQPMVGMDGRVSNGCACPRSQGLFDYLDAKYRLLAEAGPDFIWVDDDIRMGNHGAAGHGCFCPDCVAAMGDGMTREELVSLLNSPEGGEIRRAWVSRNADVIEALMEHVGFAIWAVDPGIATGLMTAGPGEVYSGAALDRWMAALGAAKLRPGGGFYTDATPVGMVYKALDTGRGSRYLASGNCPGDIQYELEDFPYQRLRKSTTALLSECTLAIATGCNGVALNMLPMWGGPYHDTAPFLPRLRQVRPGWERLVEAVDGLPTVGLWPAWHPGLLADRQVAHGEPWLATAGYATDVPYILAEIGIPLGVERWEGGAPPACGTVLSGRIAEVFSDEELLSLLSGGVLMDTTALAILEARGLGCHTGVRLDRRLTDGLMERFTDDPLNGIAAGEFRDARIEFWGDSRGKGDILEPLDSGARTLAVAHDYFRRPVGACMSAFENSLGGRVAVTGYAPWMFLQSVAKRAQLQGIADWISPGQLPVRVIDPVPLVPFARLDEARTRGAVVLLNAGLDTIDRAEVRLRVAGDERVEEVRDLAPWTTATIVIG